MPSLILTRHFRAATRVVAPAIAVAFAVFGAPAAAVAADPMGSAFTYQGRLDVMGQPANGTFDMRFELAFDDNGDSALGVLHHDDVVVIDGLFSVELGFYNELFNGNDRWLLMSVRPGSHDNGNHAEASYTPLLPWQSIRPTPLALYAERAGGLELPIDEHVNLLGAACVKIRNDSTIAIAGHSDGGLGLYAETVDGSAIFASATDASGWAATLNGRVYVHQAIGIGTAALGGFKLAVNGSAAKPGGGSWSALSDRRTKHSIEPLHGALDTLLSLRGVTFEYDPTWIEQGLALPGRQVGFIAQDVQQVLPDWVESRPDGTLYVTERGATALMVEATRELDLRQAAADREIAALRAQVAELTRRLEAMASRAIESERPASASGR